MMYLVSHRKGCNIKIKKRETNLQNKQYRKINYYKKNTLIMLRFTTTINYKNY